jgi:hypothetical protein
MRRKGPMHRGETDGQKKSGTWGPEEVRYRGPAKRADVGLVTRGCEGECVSRPEAVMRRSRNNLDRPHGLYPYTCAVSFGLAWVRWGAEGLRGYRYWCKPSLDPELWARAGPQGVWAFEPQGLAGLGRAWQGLAGPLGGGHGVASGLYLPIIFTSTLTYAQVRRCFQQPHRGLRSEQTRPEGGLPPRPPRNFSPPLPLAILFHRTRIRTCEPT